MPGIDLDAIERSIDALGATDTLARNAAPTLEMPAVADIPTSFAADDTVAEDDFSFTLSEAETSLLDAASLDDETFSHLPTVEAEVVEVDAGARSRPDAVDAEHGVERPAEGRGHRAHHSRAGRVGSDPVADVREERDAAVVGVGGSDADQPLVVGLGERGREPRLGAGAYGI